MLGDYSLRSLSMKFVEVILCVPIFISAVYCQIESTAISEAELYRNTVRAIGRKDYMEAIALGRKLIERTNKYEQVYSKIVQAARAAGQLEHAMSVFESLLRMSPPNPGGYYGIGLIYNEQKDYAKAIEYHKRCLNEQEKFLSPMLALVDAYRAVGKLNEAEEYIKSLAQSRLNNPVAYLGLGYCYLKIGRIDASLKELERASSLSPKMPDACYYRSLVLCVVGRHKDSLDVAYKCLPMIESEMNEEHRQAFLILIATNQMKMR